MLVLIRTDDDEQMVGKRFCKGKTLEKYEQVGFCVMIDGSGPCWPLALQIFLAGSD